MNSVRLLCFGLALSASLAPVQADRGGIPFEPRVTLFEPNQRALLAWNEDEELLILTTDLRASKRTQVLEVMPFPSEPTVTNADVAVFTRAVNLINSKVYLYRRYGGRGIQTAGAASASDATPPAEITFHQKIGAHDVSVAHVLSGEGFVEWVNAYLKRASVTNPAIPAPLRQVVQEYLDDGFRWFAFDVVSVENEFRTTEALQYRFKTDWLYYPVKISKANQGRTAIELLVLSPKLVGTFKGIPRRQITLEHTPVDLNPAEVWSLDKAIGAFLQPDHNTKLRIWRVNGSFKDLDRDIIAR